MTGTDAGGTDSKGAAAALWIAVTGAMITVLAVLASRNGWGAWYWPGFVLGPLLLLSGVGALLRRDRG